MSVESEKIRILTEIDQACQEIIAKQSAYIECLERGLKTRDHLISLYQKKEEMNQRYIDFLKSNPDLDLPPLPPHLQLLLN